MMCPNPGCKIRTIESLQRWYATWKVMPRGRLGKVHFVSRAFTFLSLMKTQKKTVRGFLDLSLLQQFFRRIYIYIKHKNTKKIESGSLAFLLLGFDYVGDVYLSAAFVIISALLQDLRRFRKDARPIYVVPRLEACSLRLISCASPDL